MTLGELIYKALENVIDLPAFAKIKEGTKIKLCGEGGIIWGKCDNVYYLSKDTLDPELEHLRQPLIKMLDFEIYKIRGDLDVNVQFIFSTIT